MAIVEIKKNQSNQFLKVTIFLALIGFLVYSVSLRNNFIWDDQFQIVENPLVHNLGSISKIFSGSTAFNASTGTSIGGFYRPVQMVIYACIYSFFGPHPFFFHFLQILLHIANVILVYYIISVVVGKRAGLFSSLFFLLHPIVNESVVSIASLSEVLFLFFGLLSLVVLLKKPFEKYNFLLVAMLLILSALCKETGVLFMPLILLFRWLIQKEKIGRYWISVVSSALVYGILRTQADIHYYSAHSAPFFDLSIWQRLINIPAIIFYYAKILILPVNLAVSQQWVVRSVSSAQFLVPLFSMIIIITLLSIWIIHIIRKNKTTMPVIIFFLLWLMMGLALIIQIIPLEMTVADRWLYFPFLGFLGLLSVLITNTFPNITFKAYRKFFYITVLILIIFSILNIKRSLNWHDNLSLFSHDIKISQNSANVNANLGYALYIAGRKDEAIPYFETALKMDPYNAIFENNLASAYYEQHKITEAKIHYYRALDLNNNLPIANQKLAKILLIYESPKSALDFTKKQLANLPYDTDLWFIQAIAQYKLNMKPEALESIQNAYNISPSDTLLQYYQVMKNNGSIDIKPSQ